MFYYSLFHLNLASTIELDALQTIDSPLSIDVYVRTGKISDDQNFVGDTYEELWSFKYNHRKCFFQLPEDGSKFLVEKKADHTQVTIDVSDPALFQTVLSYFYGTGLSSIMHYNGVFPVHASGVALENQLVLFCGRSGIGKSTLAAHLNDKGYRLFSDDKCVLLPHGNTKWIAKPGLKIMRLWQDALNHIDSSTFLSNPKEVVLRKDKFQFEINKNELIAKDQVLGAIFILQNTDEDAVISFRSLFGIEKLTAFRRQIFRFPMIKGMGLEKHLWVFITKLLENIPIYLVQRPQGMKVKDFAHEMDQYVRTELSKQGSEVT